MGDVLLETRTAYLSLKGTSHSLVRTRHRSRSAPRAAPAAAGRRPLTYSATLSWIKLNSAPESPLYHTVAAHAPLLGLEVLPVPACTQGELHAAWGASGACLRLGGCDD